MLKQLVYKINRFGVDYEFITPLESPMIRDGFMIFYLKDNSKYMINIDDIKDVKVYEAKDD